jgi:hypothetical protein
MIEHINQKIDSTKQASPVGATDAAGTEAKNTKKNPIPPKIILKRLSFLEEDSSFSGGFIRSDKLLSFRIIVPINSC